tara:strand:- start:31718 stop:31864 length:147 start_codon:yes stop_codon:yes gene_type:complete
VLSIHSITVLNKARIVKKEKDVKNIEKILFLSVLKVFNILRKNYCVGK